MVQNGKVKIYLADIRPLFDETMQKRRSHSWMRFADKKHCRADRQNSVRQV